MSVRIRSKKEGQLLDISPFSRGFNNCNLIRNSTKDSLQAEIQLHLKAPELKVTFFNIAPKAVHQGFKLMPESSFRSDVAFVGVTVKMAV